MSYPLRSLPVVDYSKHPAYGPALPRPGLITRLRALKAFAGGLALIVGRLIADYEHLPKPKDKARKWRWMMRRLPMYLRIMIVQRWRRLTAGSRYVPATAAGERALRTLDEDGVLAFALDAEEQARMREMLSPCFETLAARLACIAPEIRRFDDNRLWIDAEEDPEIYAWFTALLTRTGILEAARGHLNRPVEVAHLIPQINTTADDFWGRHFSDVGVDNPVCDYCHFDATYNVVKMIVYVDEVSPDNGPFCYVRGSHRAGQGFWDGLVRRANDYAALSSTKRSARELFIALPRVLQRKGAFGPDIPNDSSYARPILDNEWVITSDQGHCVVFDPQGIHRGGMVRAGERRVVTVLLAETRSR